jgi:carboxyl-terminal processing protease
MLDNTTGYIKINRFSATTYKEFMLALNNLKQLGMNNLILDLRDNPGGLLSEAISIADEFLDDQKLIVYTVGRKSPKEEFHAEKNGKFEQGRLAVLVDEGAASASEILTGAIQDWDRGIIIGRRTFGKGLVQEQFDLSNGGALRLTIARYYTPSGRCIQRSYAKGKEDYENDFEHRLASGELTGNDSLAQVDSSRYLTNNKRIVYGGGGIKPDVYIPYDTLLFNKNLIHFMNSESFQDAVWSYFIAHEKELKNYKNLSDFEQHFDVNTCLHFILKEYWKQTKITPENKRTENFLTTQVKANMARFLFRNNGYFTIFTKGDELVKRAQLVIKDKQYLKIIGEK